MDTTTLGLSVRTRHDFVRRYVTGLVDWWHNMRSRSELESLDDRCLQDIGMSRCTADFEAAKPFWAP
jgi:uncharacterized protein YjiS (DUF1127 family)